METNIVKTPNQVLGVEIVEALISEGILTKDAAKEFQKNLIAGSVKESDWKIELESSLNNEDDK